ncbi:hypothetical protein [Halosegnis marinus]|uniref:Uncharacterized protein n=1 Tax=Halosegnis marinus TaxID=3034023 RepID=A0ABD5ZM38_9EURY|nr:hypothetical protein [Halosegnis sp. DT85]
MTSLRSLVTRRRADTAVAWAVTALLAAAAVWFVRAGEPDWAVLAALLAAVATLVPVLERDPTATIPAELAALVAVPVAVRSVGALPTVTPFLATAGVALLVAVLLDGYTSLSMTPRFAAVLVVVATMAFAGAWTVGVYAADTLAGTSFVGGRVELMWDLVAATAAGVVAGVAFDAYFTYSDRVDRLESATREGDDGTDGGDLPGDERHHRYAVRAMQAALAAATVWAALARDPTLVVNTGVPLAVTLLPAVLRRRRGYAMDAGLVAWLTLASALHAAGAVWLYGRFGWYDSVTHTLSASMVAGLGYAVARATERHSRAVSFGRGFRATFVVLFVLAVGVGWEILEFASGGLASLVGGEAVLAQYGTADIVNDLLFNTVGAVLVAAGSSAHFEGVADVFVGWVRVAVRGGD